MIRVVNFVCSKKGRTSAVIFDNINDLSIDNLKKLFPEMKTDRYIKLVYRKDNINACRNAIIFEIDNEKVIAKMKLLINNDFEDLEQIFEQIINNGL